MIRRLGSTAVVLGTMAAALWLAPLPAAVSSPAHPTGTWSVVPTPDPGGEGYLADVSALTPTDAWAVGEYWRDPPHHHINPLIEHWDGSSWSVVPSPSPGYYAGLSGVLALSQDNVWAIGSSSGKRSLDIALIEHWDGSSWSVVPSPSPGAASGLYDLSRAGTAGRIWVAGYSQADWGGPYAPMIERWNGSRWKIVETQDPPNGGELDAITAVSEDDAWAVGNSGVADHALTEHWDGRSWQIVPDASTDPLTLLGGVAATSGSDVWAVGESLATEKRLLEHWDGKAWSVVDDFGTGYGQLNDLVARSPSSVWAVGEHQPHRGPILTLTEWWNGAAWRVVRSPQGRYAESNLFAVASVPGTKQMWAVGISTPSDGSAAAQLIELYS